MAELKLGPVALRCYSGSNWTHLELAFVTDGNGGMARRETAINAGFKSEHLLEAVGTENPADAFTCPTTGQTYYGKIMQTPTGVYAISAKEVYTKALYSKAVKQGLRAAESATETVTVVDIAPEAETSAA